MYFSTKYKESVAFSQIGINLMHWYAPAVLRVAGQISRFCVRPITPAFPGLQKRNTVEVEVITNIPLLLLELSIIISQGMSFSQ